LCPPVRVSTQSSPRLRCRDRVPRPSSPSGPEQHLTTLLTRLVSTPLAVSAVPPRRSRSAVVGLWSVWAGWKTGARGPQPPPSGAPTFPRRPYSPQALIQNTYA
jgi:hypothetical protein